MCQLPINHGLNLVHTFPPLLQMESAIKTCRRPATRQRAQWLRPTLRLPLIAHKLDMGRTAVCPPSLPVQLRPSARQQKRRRNRGMNLLRQHPQPKTDDQTSLRGKVFKPRKTCSESCPSGEQVLQASLTPTCKRKVTKLNA